MRNYTYIYYLFIYLWFINNILIDFTENAEGVLSFTDVRVRKMGPYTIVDLTIQVDNHISVSAAGQVIILFIFVLISHLTDLLEKRLQRELEGQYRQEWKE